MSSTQIFGRTNVSYPKQWLSLSVPHTGFDQESAEKLIESAVNFGSPIDISSQPALWGGFLRKYENAQTVTRGTLQIEQATSEDHATDLVQAHLIETLSSIGNEKVDFYFLRIRRTLEEFQINGTLAALEFAKQEGNIGYLGLQCDGPALAVLGFWQFHDGFDALMLPSPLDSTDARDTLLGLADQRRVGVLLHRTTQYKDRNLEDLGDLEFLKALRLATHDLPSSVSACTLVDVRSTRQIELLSQLGSVDAPSRSEFLAELESKWS